MPAPKFCWDSCVFIALLTGEERPQEDTDGLREVVDLVDRRQATIITSSLVRSEVFDDASDPTSRQRFEDLFKRPSCVLVDVNRAISDKAGQLRAQCRASGRRLETPDAIFLATALLFKVDALHTFDTKLLALSGNPAVGELVVTKPHAVQTILDL